LHETFGSAFFYVYYASQSHVQTHVKCFNKLNFWICFYLYSYVLRI